MSRNIEVTGIGKIKLKPDLITINMTVEAKDEDYSKAVELASAEVDKIISALVSAGHDKDNIKTINFNVNTEYDSYQDNNTWKNRLIGYRCTHDLKLEFELDMNFLGITVSAISSSGISPEFSINFSVKDRSAVTEQLLTAAVKDASDKASILSRAAGVTLGNIENIICGSNNIYPASKVRSSKIMYSANADTNFFPDDIEVSGSVTVVWSIE